MSSTSSSPANLAAVPTAATAVVPLLRHRSRQVGFNIRTQVYLVPSLSEYTDEELEACFTTEQDTKRNQRDIVTSITGARNHGTNAEGICIRGLEYLVNPSDIQDRHAAKERHYDAILDEQDYQWDAGVPTDWDAIAKASLCSSQESRDRAQMMGAKDAVAARKINETIATTADNNKAGRINKRRSSVHSVASHRRSSSFSECSLPEEVSNEHTCTSQVMAAANQQQVATQV